MLNETFSVIFKHRGFRGKILVIQAYYSFRIFAFDCGMKMQATAAAWIRWGAALEDSEVFVWNLPKGNYQLINFESI